MRAHQERHVGTRWQRASRSPLAEEQEVIGPKTYRKSPRFGNRLNGFEGRFKRVLCREASIDDFPKKRRLRQPLLACQRNESLSRFQRHPRHEMSVVFHRGAIFNQTAAARLSCKSIEFAHKRRNSNNNKQRPLRSRFRWTLPTWKWVLALMEYREILGKALLPPQENVR